MAKKSKEKNGNSQYQYNRFTRRYSYVDSTSDLQKEIQIQRIIKYVKDVAKEPNHKKVEVAITYWTPRDTSVDENADTDTKQ